MIRDLRTILEGWDYEPGKISVRKIIGRDGREKIQTRIDLGVLQLEVEGRPDGKRPNGFESLLAFHEKRLSDHVSQHGDDERFVLSPEDCRELRHEAYIYYQRYLSNFVLEEFKAVIHDTDRNLRLTRFCAEYGSTPVDREALKTQLGYLLMMNIRAKAYLALERKQFDEALREVDRGIGKLNALETGDGDESEYESASCETELSVLDDLREEILAKMPVDSRARLQWELQAAIEAEDYELAARLRDRLSEWTD